MSSSMNTNVFAIDNKHKLKNINVFYKNRDRYTRIKQDFQIFKLQIITRFKLFHVLLYMLEYLSLSGERVIKQQKINFVIYFKQVEIILKKY